MFGLSGSSFTYILIAVIVVIGLYLLITKIIKKKKQKDNFNAFVKPSIKEKLKQDGYANHSYEITNRYHHSLVSQNKEGRVDLILKVINPKLGESSAVMLGYTLTLKEVPVSKKEFVWEVQTIEKIEIEEIKKLLKEKEERKKHPIKYLYKDVGTFKSKTTEKIKKISIKKVFLKKSKSEQLENKDQKEIPLEDNQKTNEKIENPFDAL